MRTDDPLDLSKYYAQRNRVLQELGALRDFARLRNCREWQWRRLWLSNNGIASGRIKHMNNLLSTKYSDHEIDLIGYLGERSGYLRDRKYARQR